MPNRRNTYRKAGEIVLGRNPGTLDGRIVAQNAAGENSYSVNLIV